jgi:hypothetical protein
MSEQRRTLINLEDCPVQANACASTYVLKPYVPLAFPDPISAQVFLRQAGMAGAKVEYFDPAKHIKLCREYLRQHPDDAGYVELIPSDKEMGTQDESVAAMIQIGTTRLRKPTWTQIQSGGRDILKSYLFMLSQPIINEKGKELSTLEMRGRLCEVFNIQPPTVVKEFPRTTAPAHRGAPLPEGVKEEDLVDPPAEEDEDKDDEGDGDAL